MSYEVRGYEAKIGIEIHVQLNTKSKIFSSDGTEFSAGDNENISPVSAGLPGSLPVLNKKVVDLAIKTGLALNCQIRQKSVFARKNYFYPDLPKGYQISQFEEPICEHGEVQLKMPTYEKRVSITRAHLEEDAGKSTHSGEFTLLNYNRAGVPLLEIVSGPDLSSPQEAAEYGKMIRQIVRYLDVCDGNLEEGSLRCDCNVSVKRVGEKQLGTRVELKNINSFRFIEKAVEFEIDRQVDLVERGEKIIQETRLYDSDKNRTFTMRVKEDAMDYRYFPDPDLLPIRITAEKIESFRKMQPELPQARLTRFVSALGLPVNDAIVLTDEKDVADYFEAVAKACGNAKAASNWIMTEVLREMKSNPINILEAKMKPTLLGELISLIDKGIISGKTAKVVFVEAWETGKSPRAIVDEKGLIQVSDDSVIEKIIDSVLKDNEKNVVEYRSGKTKVFGFFVGQIMKFSKGQANPDKVNEILKKKLEQG